VRHIGRGSLEFRMRRRNRLRQHPSFNILQSMVVFSLPEFCHETTTVFYGIAKLVGGSDRSRRVNEAIDPAGNSLTASRCASGKFWMATLEKTHARPPLIYAITGTAGELSVSLLGCRAVRTIPVTAERGLRLQCAAPTDSSRRLG
jgi:hypothetical protein